MGHGLDERWGGGVWLLGSGKIQFVAATDVRHISTISGAGIYGGSSDTIGGAVDQGDETVERNERDEAAIDGAVAAGETYAAQDTLDDGEGRGGGMALKLSKAQKRHARRGRLKILAKTIEER